MNTPRRIVGAKFFQNELDYIKIYNNEYSGTKITAAALSTYLLLHYRCDDFGRIREDEFSLKELTDKYSLPYSSINRGFHLLLEIGLIKYLYENGKHFIILNNYEIYNGPDYDGSMNYFIMPTFLLESGALNQFIKARDVAGLIGLLDLLNTLYRQHSINGGGSISRAVDTWLKRMKKTTRNIKAWIKRISAIFECDKKAGNFIREGKYILKFKDTVFGEQKIDPRKQRLGAKVRKDIQHFFKTSKLQYQTKDINDCYHTILSDVLDKIFEPFLEIPNGNKTMRTLLQGVISASCDRLLEKGFNIQNIGGLFRNITREEMKQQFTGLDLESKQYFRIWHAKYKQPLPTFFSN
ncbi:hypothetical protein [Viridibacillus arvi]|uniref:hypothetical protein n=1 Tax=Viridibacillus arvi TaxID=263475 RepID=UPI0034CDEE1F